MTIPASRTKSYAAAALVDVDGIKTSFASSAAIKTIVPADFNGAVLGAGASMLDLPRTVTISRSSAANQYSILPIVVTGMRGGRFVAESLTPENDDGNDTLVTVSAFDTLTSIVIPADASTGGAYTIGVQDICAPCGDKFCGVELASDGNLIIQYGEPAGSPTDTIPVVVAVRSFFEIAPTRILTAAMSDGITVYLP